MHQFIMVHMLFRVALFINVLRWRAKLISLTLSTARRPETFTSWCTFPFALIVSVYFFASVFKFFIYTIVVDMTRTIQTWSSFGRCTLTFLSMDYRSLSLVLFSLWSYSYTWGCMSVLIPTYQFSNFFVAQFQPYTPKTQSRKIEE